MQNLASHLCVGGNLIVIQPKVITWFLMVRKWMDIFMRFGWHVFGQFGGNLVLLRSINMIDHSTSTTLDIVKLLIWSWIMFKVKEFSYNFYK